MDFKHAAANLFRLITERQGGYDEGADQWRKALRILRDDPGSFLERDAT